MPGVPEYDAFGREIDEDPLKAFRHSEPAPVVRADPVAAAPPEAVVSAPEPVATPAQRLPSARPRRRRRRGGFARLLVLFAVLGAGALVIGNASVSIDSSIDDIVGSLPDPSAPEPHPAATGITGQSLIRRANFEAAVAALAGAGLGRPLTMRVAPDRIDATLIGAGGRLHQVQVTPDGELRELASTAGAPSN